MKENAIMDSIQRQLIKKYHAVAHAAGLSDDERRSILEAYGVESSRDLSQHDLIDIIAKISHDMPGNLDKLRKRLIASIGGYLRATGQTESVEKITAIAVRASGYPRFNAIPAERLRSLAYAFSHKVKDIQAVDKLTEEILKLKPKQ